MTSWPRCSSSSSTPGLTFTRSLRPPVKTSTVPSSLRCEEDAVAGRRLRQPVDLLLEGHDLVAGLLEGRHEPLVLPGDRGQTVPAPRQPLFEYRTCRGDSASLRRSTAISSSRKETCVWRSRTSFSCCAFAPRHRHERPRSSPPQAETTT